MVVESTDILIARQNQLELNPGSLKAGTYLIVPITTTCRILNEKRYLLGNTTSSSSSSSSSDSMSLGLLRDCVLSVHSNKVFSLEKTDYDSLIYEFALNAPVVSRGVKNDLFGDGALILYSLKHGSCGNSYVIENKKKTMYINVITTQIKIKA